MVNSRLPKILKQLEKDPENKELLVETAFIYMRADQPYKVLEIGNKLIEIGERSGDRDYALMWGNFFSASTILEGNNRTAGYKKLETARSIAEATHNRDALKSIYNLLGLYTMFFNNDIYTAVTYYYNALDEAKKTDDKIATAMILSNIAGAYLTMKDPAGIRLAKQAVEITANTNPHLLFKPRIILAELYLIADSIDAAEKEWVEIHNFSISGQIPGYENIVDLIEADIARKRGDFSKAERIYRKIRDSYPNESPSLVASSCIGHASVLQQQHRIEEAIKELEFGLQNAKKTEQLIHSPEIVKMLVQCYKKIGQTDRALNLSLEASAYNDSIFTIGRERTLQENRIRHEVYTQERLIDEQNMKIASDQHKIALLILGIATLIIVLGVAWWSYRKKDKLYEAIVLQNQQFLQREKIYLEKIEKVRNASQAAEEKEPEYANSSGDASVTSDVTLNKKFENLMERFNSMMLEHHRYTDPSITVQSIAEELCTNRTYLSKAINDIAGKTFTQIVNEYRVHRAIEMISDLKADYPLKQIAAEVGFNSISTFYSTFQASTGMPPARYRAKLREM